VIGGTVNGSGSLRFKATKVGSDTALAQIVQLVQTEADSEHPLAGAIVEGAEDRQLALLPYSQIKAIAGGGVQAHVDGDTVLVGTPKLLAENTIQLQPAEQEELTALQAEGKTAMLVAMNGQVVGLVAVADRVRATSRQTIAQLKALRIGVAMLTGDNQRTAEAVGRELGIDRVFAEVLPSDKATYVKQLQGEGLFTCWLLRMSDTSIRLEQAKALAEQERAKAERADHSRRELIVNVSHELRTPIASIRGHVESLLMEVEEQEGGNALDPAQVRDYLTIVHREAERLSALVEDLLSLARMDADELYLDVVPLVAGEVVEEVSATMAPLASRDTTLKAEIRASPALQADETGWREDGINGYIWSVCTASIRYYEYHHSRSGEVVKQLIGENFQGVLGSDFYAGYNAIRVCINGAGSTSYAISMTCKTTFPRMRPCKSGPRMSKPSVSKRWPGPSRNSIPACLHANSTLGQL
jgi:signal transduction histidine kinase